MDIKKITCRGFQAKADMGVHHNEAAMLVSFYAPLQIVKGICSCFATYDTMEVEGVGELTRPKELMRFRCYPFGYGRGHGLIWSEDVGRSIIFAFGDNLGALQRALAPRKVPHLREWLPWIYKVLQERALMTELDCWGGVSGIRLSKDDDAICNAIAEGLAIKQALQAA